MAVLLEFESDTFAEWEGLVKVHQSNLQVIGVVSEDGWRNCFNYKTIIR